MARARPTPHFVLSPLPARFLTDSLSLSHVCVCTRTHTLTKEFPSAASGPTHFSKALQDPVPLAL